MAGHAAADDITVKDCSDAETREFKRPRSRSPRGDPSHARASDGRPAVGVREGSIPRSGSTVRAKEQNEYEVMFQSLRIESEQIRAQETEMRINDEMCKKIEQQAFHMMHEAATQKVLNASDEADVEARLESVHHWNRGNAIYGQNLEEETRRPAEVFREERVAGIATQTLIHEESQEAALNQQRREDHYFKDAHDYQKAEESALQREKEEMVEREQRNYYEMTRDIENRERLVQDEMKENNQNARAHREAKAEFENAQRARVRCSSRTNPTDLGLP